MNPIISYGTNLSRAHDLKQIRLFELLYRCKSSTFSHETDYHTKKLKKEELPFYLPSGIFTKNSIDGIIPDSYTNIVCIDIDYQNKDTTDIPDEELLTLKGYLINNLPENSILFISNSISKKGIYILFKLNFENTKYQQDKPNKTLEQIKARHTLFYQYAYETTKHTLSTYTPLRHSYQPQIDKLNNLNRARIISSDSTAYLNEQATLFIPETYLQNYLNELNLKNNLKNSTNTNNTSRSPHQNVVSVTPSKCSEFFKLATTWATNKFGTYQKGNRNKFIHHVASALNNLGVPKETAIELISTNILNTTTDSISDEFKRSILNGYARTDQFGTYIINSDLSLKERVLKLINKKYSYLAKVEESKSLPILDELQVLNDIFDYLSEKFE
jgi:hypothetical protein